MPAGEGASPFSFGGSGESLSRRGLLRIAAGTLAALGVAFWSSKKDDTVAAAASSWDEKLPVSPPGSKSRGNFSKKCVACTACVVACPAGILRPSLGEWGPEGLFQPVLDYGRGYCQYGCTACGDACPRGPSSPWNREKNSSFPSGRPASFGGTALSGNMGLPAAPARNTAPPGDAHGSLQGGLTIPELDTAVCLGCGACEYACPAEPKAVTVSGLAVHGKIPSRIRRKRGAHSGPLEDFPF